MSSTVSVWVPVAVTAGTVALTTTAALLAVYLRQGLRVQERKLALQESELQLERRVRQDSDDSYPSLVRQLVVQQNEVLEQLRRSQQNVVVNLPSERLYSQTEGVSVGEDYISLMKDLSHSLNTPLSQVEAIVLRLQQSPNRLPVGEDLAKISAAIDICKSFLIAFRDLATVADNAAGWDARSLPNALKAAARLYGDSLHREDVTVEVEMPPQLHGYSNSYVLSILLPLLENAIESAKSGTSVWVTTAREVPVGAESMAISSIVMDVESEPNELPPESDEIYTAGVTSKSGHDGQGLTVVSRLVSMTSGATIAHYIAGGKEVVFRVSLPAERSS